MGRGFWCSLIGCQPFRERSGTGRRSIVNIVENYLQEWLFCWRKGQLSLDKRKCSQMPAIALCNFRDCRRIHPGSPIHYVFPYRFYVFKRLSSALWIYLQSIGNQLTISRQLPMPNYTFLGIHKFLSPVVVRDRRFLLAAGGRWSVFTSVWLGLKNDYASSLL